MTIEQELDHINDLVSKYQNSIDTILDGNDDYYIDNKDYIVYW